MRTGTRWVGSAVAAVLVCGLWTVLPSPELARADESLSAGACFTPGQDCTGQLVKLLNAARREILVQAYSFTSAPIAKALRDAHKRGVAVIVILDKSQRTSWRMLGFQHSLTRRMPSPTIRSC